MFKDTTGRRLNHISRSNWSQSTFWPLEGHIILFEIFLSSSYSAKAETDCECIKNICSKSCEFNFAYAHSFVLMCCSLSAHSA